VSAQADIGREAPKEGDFNRPEQAVTEVTLLGPQAHGRPSPTFPRPMKGVGAGRHLARGAQRGRFQSA